MKRNFVRILIAFSLVAVLGIVSCIACFAEEEEPYIEVYKNDQWVKIYKSQINLSSTVVKGKGKRPTVTIEGYEEDVDFFCELNDENPSYAGKKNLVVAAVDDRSPHRALSFTFTQKRSLSSGYYIYLTDAQYDFTGLPIKPNAKVGVNGEGTKWLKAGTDFTLTFSNNTKLGSKAKITATGKGNYYGTKSRYFEIVVTPIKKSWVTLKTTTFTYDGKAHYPGVSVVRPNGVKLVKGTDYTLKYDTDADAGEKSLIVRGKGNYDSSFFVSYYIKPKTIGISSLSYGSGSVKVNFSKCKSSGADSYQIAYRQVGNTKWKYTTTAYTYKTLKNLQKGKKYEIRVRSRAPRIGNGWIYSNYSPIYITAKIK